MMTGIEVIGLVSGEGPSTFKMHVSPDSILFV